MQGSQTLGKSRKGAKGAQRHSAGNVDYDNAESDTGGGLGPAGTASSSGQSAFRSRSRTVSDVHGKQLLYSLTKVVLSRLPTLYSTVIKSIVKP